MKKHLYILLFLFVFINTKAQINFENSYSSGGYDYARAIVQTFDSGYVTVGSTEGNFGLSDLYLLKVDKTGEIMWGKRYGGSNIDWAQDIIQTYDSNLMVVGYSNSNSSSDYGIYLVKTDYNGDSIYTKTINWDDWDFAYSLQETADSGYIIAGETYQNGNSQALLIKTNKEGDTIWTKTYGGANDDKFEKVIITASGDYLMAGTTESFGNQKQAYIVKTDNLGSIIWEKNYGNAQNDFAKSLLELSTSEIVFTGATNTPPETDYDNWTVRLDALGNIIGDSKVPDYTQTGPTEHNDDYFEAIVEVKDSLIFGGNRSYNFSNQGNLYCEITNKPINAGRWFLKFASYEFESIHDIKKCSDGGVIFVCSSEGLGIGGSSIYLIKIDSNLTFPSHQSTSITNKNDISSIDDNIVVNKKNSFICYPNPTQGMLYFNINNSKLKNSEITITDLAGKKLESITPTEQNISLDFSSYNNGIYLASLMVNNSFVKQVKIIISK